jgi:hypothetical protein
MSIGARIGARIGAAIGASIGGDPLGAALTWTKDAAAGKGTPANAAEWVSVLAASGVSVAAPASLWLMQEAAGNLTDTIGGITLTASGTGLAYQQAVAGWTRKALTTTDAGTGTFASTSASLPDISTTSALLFAILQFNAAPAATRSVLTMGTTVVDCEITLTPRLRQVCGANNLNGAVDPTGAVRGVWVRINRTAGNSVLYTTAEKVTPAFGATATGKQLKVGGAGAASANVSYLYLAQFTGANAELSDAQLKTIGTTLGWSFP